MSGPPSAERQPDAPADAECGEEFLVARGQRRCTGHEVQFLACVSLGTDLGLAFGEVGKERCSPGREDVAGQD